MRKMKKEEWQKPKWILYEKGVLYETWMLYEHRGASGALAASRFESLKT